MQQTDSSPYQCAQIYFKGENEDELRQKYSSQLNAFILIQLQAMLLYDCQNPFVLQFKKAKFLLKINLKFNHNLFRFWSYFHFKFNLINK